MLALGILLNSLSVDSNVSLTSSGSAWVYTHASDPTGDPMIRVWGIGGQAIPDDPGDAENFSFGYLQFDVSKLSTARLKAAKLVLWNANPPMFTPAIAAEFPLEARALLGDFSAKDWNYAKSANVAPGPKTSVFGVGREADKPDSTGKMIEIDIDLMKGPGKFGDYLAKAESSPTKTVTFSLTSAIDASAMQNGQGGGIYKVFSSSKSNAESIRPTLQLTFDTSGN